MAESAVSGILRTCGITRGNVGNVSERTSPESEGNVSTVVYAVVPNVTDGSLIVWGVLTGFVWWCMVRVAGSWWLRQIGRENEHD